MRFDDVGPAPTYHGDRMTVSTNYTAAPAPPDAPHPDPPKQPEEMAPTPGGASVVAVPTNTTNVTATALQPWVISMGRGVAEAFVYAGYAVFAMLAAVPDADTRAIVIVAGGAFFLRCAAAFGIGLVDQANSKKV